MHKIVNSIADRVAALRDSIDMDTDPADVLDWALAAIEKSDDAEEAAEEAAVEETASEAPVAVAPAPAPAPVTEAITLDAKDALRDASTTSPLQRHIAHHNGVARCDCNDPGGLPPCAFCMIALETEAAAYLRDGERAVNALHGIADDLFHLTDDDLRRELARRAEARYANALSDAAAEIRIREQALADAREKMRALIAAGKV